MLSDGFKLRFFFCSRNFAHFPHTQAHIQAQAGYTVWQVQLEIQRKSMSQSRVEDRWRNAQAHFPLNSDLLGNPWPTGICCTSAAPLLLLCSALLCNWRAEAALVRRKFSNDLRKFQKNKEYKRKEEKREERVCVSLCVCVCVCVG